jgi:asparagine synthase (glutamine-hydrolysing)
MCGIAGIFDVSGCGLATRSALEPICDALNHRGPDETGYFIDDFIALGHRRLSIIDLSSGQQPMSNEDGTVWVTFNGEIYNFLELRQRLVVLGHRFATHSDTEVIVHAYEQFGVDCVRQFRGMFAFAIWDSRNCSLMLARDRVGKKPLFYTESSGQFIFASELQALVKYEGILREVDYAAIDDYLTYGYIPAPNTIYRNVYKLLPAHYLTFKLNKAGNTSGLLRIERYWQLDYGPKHSLSEEQAIEGFLDVFNEAVRLRLIADVPLGALLSGGIDSGLVVALMSKLSARPVKTFSIGFEERDFDELPAARAVARRYGTNHHELIVRANAMEVLPLLIRHYGEPFADSSAIPSYYVAKLAREHVKVALNGDGGDESFGGYERYFGGVLADQLRRRLPLALKGLNGLARSVIPKTLSRKSRLSKVARFLAAASSETPQCYMSWIAYLSPLEKNRVYAPDFRNQLGGHDGEAWLVAECAVVERDGDVLETLMALDVRSYLPYDLLVKMDIASMACSLEARSPFLDHKVMEFAARLPSHLKLRGRILKYLPKKAAIGLLPAENLKRRKMGFGVPVGAWMRNDLRPLLEDVLLAPAAKTSAYFQRESLRKMVDDHVRGGRDLGSQLWALLWLEMWHREFMS